MSNSNTNLQTQSSNALHNAIMEAGSKDRPPMLAPGSSETTKEEGLKQGESINVQDLETNLYWEFGKFTSRDGESLESYYSRFYKMMNELVRNQCNVTNHQVNVPVLLQLQPEWQRFETLGLSRSQELKTVSYHKLYDILKQHQNEVNEIRTERLARTANPLALSTRKQRKSMLTPSAPTYDPEPATVTEDEEMSKEKEIDKLMALISLSFKKIYKPTNNNLRTSSNTSRTNQDNSPRTNRGTGYDNQRAINVAGARENVGTPVVQKSGIQCYNCKEYGHVSRECQKPKRVKDAAYHKEKMLLCKQEEAGVQLNAEQADWKDDTDDESDDQELEAHYMYMAQLQEVTPDPVDNSGPIFDDEPTHKVQNNNDNYNVFAMENEHPEQLEPSNDIYLTEQGDSNITIDSSDICYDRAQDDQDETDDLDQERDLLASLIQKLKCEIDDSKNRNKFLESSNKELVNKLKGEIEDFKTKNKSLESSNNHFKEANNELSKTNQLMFKDLKKFQAELDKYKDVNYASKVEIDCAKAKGDLMSYKIDFEKSSNAYTQQINDLNQTDSIRKRAFCCYNDNLALMLAPDSDETIRLEKERRSKLSDLIRPFDYDQLNNLYDWFVPQREKSAEQHYFPKTSKMCHTSSNKEFSKESFRKQSTLLEKRMDESIPWDQKCKSSKELFKIKKSVFDTILMEWKQEMVADLRYFNSLEHEVDTLKSQLETQKTQFLNEIDRLSREYYYADHMNAILGIYTDLDEFTDLQCDYGETLEKCEHLEKELSKSRTMSKNFESLQKHAINLDLISTLLEFKTSEKPMAVPISTRKPKQNVNNLLQHPLIEIILFIVDSGCSKHMTGNLKLLINFVEKFLGTVKFGNDQIAPILGYGDLVQGAISIKRVYYVEGLNHNLFSVGQFCDADLEVTFRKSSCYIRDLKEMNLLTVLRAHICNSITLQDSTTPNPICLMAKATSSQAWLWHRRLSHLNFDSINLLSKNNIVNGLPKLKSSKIICDLPCDWESKKKVLFILRQPPSPQKDGYNFEHMGLSCSMR
ncbi:integrase, catalytic region, zinc finger, CCHC-type containing protein [Tanacetum coccineum]